jgi:glycosyltransferase involved in cell wall biosynthesis
VRSWGRRVLAYPDAQIGWYPAAVAAGLRAARRDRFDAVYSSSNPVTTHLVAQTISRRTRVPWVAEFRDPWADRLPPDSPHKRRAVARERAIAERAAEVIMPTPTWAEYYGRLWGRHVAVLPNGHDGMPAKALPQTPVLSHLGTFYPGIQSLSALWKALAQLAASTNEPVPRVRFIGDLPAETRQEAEAQQVGHLLEVTGFVSHEEAVRAVAASSMLLASGFPADSPATAGWVPAKLFEYLASDRPILFLGPRDTEAARLLKDEPGCFVVDPGDTSGTLAALREGLRMDRVARETDRHSRQRRASELAAILNRVAEPGVGRG